MEEIRYKIRNQASQWDPDSVSVPHYGSQFTFLHHKMYKVGPGLPFPFLPSHSLDPDLGTMIHDYNIGPSLGRAGLGRVMGPMSGGPVGWRMVMMEEYQSVWVSIELVLIPGSLYPGTPPENLVLGSLHEAQASNGVDSSSSTFHPHFYQRALSMGTLSQNEQGD